MKMEKVSVTFSVTMIPFMSGCEECMADQLDLDWGQTKPSMGGSRDGCNGTRHSAIEHFCMESEAYKICEGWETGECDAAFPTNAARRNESWQIHFCSGD